MYHDAGFFFGLAAIFAGGVQIGIQLGIMIAHAQRDRPRSVSNHDAQDAGDGK